MFNPVFRSADMRARMSGGRPGAVILTYVGRLGAGAPLSYLQGSGPTIGFACALQLETCPALRPPA